MRSCRHGRARRLELLCRTAMACLVELIHPAGQPKDQQCHEQHNHRRAEQSIDLEASHSRRLQSAILATKCRTAPRVSQAIAAKVNAAVEIVADVGTPNTKATMGAMTPVTMVAAANALRHAAVSLVLSL